MIIMLSGDNCSACDMLKARLDAGGFKYKPVGVKSQQGIALVRELNVRSIPVLVKQVEGKAVMTINGSNKPMSTYKEFFND